MTQDDRIPFSRRSFFKSFIAATVLATGLFGCGGSGNDNDDIQTKPYASWYAAMSNASVTLPGRPAPVVPTFENQTVRHVLRLSLGGDTIRLKVSNLFGVAPLTFSGVHAAKSTDAGNIDPATDRTVTFNGQSTLAVAPGAEVYSDPITLPVSPLTNLAVSMYFAGPTEMRTIHSLGRQNSYIGSGNLLNVASIPVGAPTQQSYYGLTAVEATSPEKTNVVVTFGDSITDGFASTVDAGKRYPNQLDDRLKAAGFTRTGVANAGISGNRWLNEVAGPSGNSRFERDVLSVAGVTHTIILLGINDIGFPAVLNGAQEVSADQIITSMDAAVKKAKAKGIKVMLGTLLPFKGAGYYTEAGEAKRQAVNAWIRNNREVDGVIDFDRVMQNPADPLTMLPAYDSGDHLHPNDAGYAAMAAAIDLNKLQ